jgi:predicted lipoprotein with Yx(FWY)xxD motif
MTIQWLAATVLGTGLLMTAIAPARAATDPPVRKLDGVLVDDKGRGLYIYTGDDELGRSKCNAQCRLLWPPLVAAADARPTGPFTLAKRDDGTVQWALRGRPLYRWASDRKYGDHGGNGVSDRWRLVTVGADKPKAATSSPYQESPKP